jgi:LacI family transcriptional regulator
VATLDAIATKAKASKSTVSYVLRGKAKEGRVSPQRAAEILAVAQRLGFRPNAAAMAVSTGRFGCVALVQSISPTHSNLPAGVVHGVQQVLRPLDMHLMLAELPDQQLVDDGYVPKILRQLMADGLLINYTHDAPDRMVELLERHQIPSIWMNIKRSADCIFPDDYGAGAAATRRLIEMGHRHIAYADLTVSSHYSVADRQRGYVDAMREAGLEPMLWLEQVPPVTDPRQGQQDGRLDVARRWLARADRPTAVLTYAGNTAVPMQHAALMAGLRIPQDLSLVTFGDWIVNPLGIPITTMMVRMNHVGAEGVRMLLQKIEAPNQPLAPLSVGFEWLGGQTTASRT